MLKKNSLAWDLGKLSNVIHVGARYGEEVESYVQNGANSILLFEPNPLHIAGLYGNIGQYSDRAAIVVSNLALGSFSGVAEFTSFLGFSSGLSSLNAFDKDRLIKIFAVDSRHKSLLEDKEISFMVVVERLDVYLERCRLGLAASHSIDLLNIDTQGSEMNVLLGAQETLNRVANIICEVTLRPDQSPYHDCPSFAAIAKFLFKRGFSLVGYHIWGEFGHGQALFQR